tara:strand:+ start:221 stop:1063 length:843 start_codon:yes stop_codon:yes gene_type:complete
MSENNKWKKPSNPPPPLFLGEKERNLVKQVNDELLERIIGQQITYLPISVDYTNFHPLYGEAIEKSFLPPVRVYALVEFDGITTTTENYGLDKEKAITVRFHERRLHEDQNLMLREGDYVQYGNSFYEIVSLTEDRQLFGQIDHLFQISARCIRTRRGIMDMSVLSTELQASLSADSDDHDSSASGSPSEDHTHSYSVVRVMYCYDSVGELPADTALNSYLGYTGEVKLANSAVYLNGSRQEFKSGEASGAEYYVENGYLYSNYKINNGERVLLEVLTIV